MYVMIDVTSFLWAKWIFDEREASEPPPPPKKKQKKNQQQQQKDEFLQTVGCKPFDSN